MAEEHRGGDRQSNRFGGSKGGFGRSGAAGSGKRGFGGRGGSGRSGSFGGNHGGSSREGASRSGGSGRRGSGFNGESRNFSKGSGRGGFGRDRDGFKRRSDGGRFEKGSDRRRSDNDERGKDFGTSEKRDGFRKGSGGEGFSRGGRNDGFRPQHSNGDKGAHRGGGKGPRRDGSKHASDRAPQEFKYRPRKLRKTRATPARIAALEVIRNVRERDAFAQQVIAAVIDDSTTMSVEDRAFATRLALGVVSSRGTLDEIIDRALNNPTDVFRETRDALQLSTYEIVFLGKEPFAAVDQGVELVKSFSPGAVSVANACLHNIVRLRLQFPFGDPNTDIDAFARLHAFPTWLCKRLIDNLGPQGAADFMRASNEPAPLFISVNAAKATVEQVVRTFERVEEEALPVSLGDSEVEGCLRLPERRSLLIPAVKRMIEQGKILVSDAASQMVATAVLPERKPTSVLEVGAGRGTKTILLQSAALRAYGSQMSGYVTVDDHAFKTRLLRERAVQYGVKVAEGLTGDATHLDDVVGEKTFDFVFVDAPCSGLGTLRRHPEIRWRVGGREIKRCVKTQHDLLASAAAHVAVGGTLAYATCTVIREENAGVVKAFLESEAGKGFKLVPIAGRSHLMTRLAPGSSDAHFAVKFVRVSEDRSTADGAGDVLDGQHATGAVSDGQQEAAEHPESAEHSGVGVAPKLAGEGSDCASGLADESEHLGFATDAGASAVIDQASSPEANEDTESAARSSTDANADAVQASGSQQPAAGISFSKGSSQNEESVSELADETNR